MFQPTLEDHNGREEVVTAEQHQVDVVDVHKKIISEPPFDDEATPPGSCDVGPKMWSVRRSDAGGR